MKELSKKQIALRMTGVFVFVIIALIIAVAFLPGEKTQLSPRQALESSLRSTSSCSNVWSALDEAIIEHFGGLDNILSRADCLDFIDWW